MAEQQQPAWGFSESVYRELPAQFNAGIGGATIREAARHVHSMVEALQPRDWVVFTSGENDIADDADISADLMCISKRYSKRSHPVQIKRS